jgi:hypothetical protein
MNKGNKSWSVALIEKEALKYKTRGSFQMNSHSAYNAAKNKKILDRVCPHMVRVHEEWNVDKIINKSKNYNKRSIFQKEDMGAYAAATRMCILDDVCSHMDKSSNVSASEKDLFDTIRSAYPETQRLIDRNITIQGKSHIKGFHIDIYVPELRKGIEFDGTYWHSVEGLKRSRKHWPQEDLENYSHIKDGHFKSKNIEILHIYEDDWKKDKTSCIDNCFQFLSKVN